MHHMSFTVEWAMKVKFVGNSLAAVRSSLGFATSQCPQCINFKLDFLQTCCLSIISRSKSIMIVTSRAPLICKRPHS